MPLTNQVDIENKQIEEKFQDLLKHCSRCDKPDDKELINKAFHVANEAHRGMRRKSGEPYIYHPIEVAKIVTYEIGLGAKSVACALLHDVVEDTDYTIKDIKTQFGDKIASIIDGLTKISGVFDKKSSLQAENFRKMLLTLSDDVRVILIKLADRLHNMRTLDSLPPNKRMKIAGETIYLFAPLAHRLGLYTIKTELEDLSLKYRHPQIFEEIMNKIQDNEEKRVKLINKLSLPIIQKLEENHIEFDISGRPKSIYSIFHKMQMKNIQFEEVYDLLAIRIVFKPQPGIHEKTQCWNIYSMITDIYRPKPERIRDWVSSPKANGYEALHCTVMSPMGKWVEVQIRSDRMDEIAERGFAAHWKYKGEASQETELDKWIKRIKEMLENHESNALEFLDEFKLNLFSSEIMIFTPKGEVKTLPKESTCLDLAYEIHTEVGNKAIGAKVNYRLVPLNHVLQSGDQVEILTSDVKRTQKEWLGYVVTAKAKSNIKDALKSENRNRITKGKIILENRLKELGLHPNSRIMRKLLDGYQMISKDELYSRIGMGIQDLSDLKKIIRKKSQNKFIKYWGLQLSRSTRSKKVSEKTPKKIDLKQTILLRENVNQDEPEYKLAKCCNPIPGDEVIGYKTPNENILIHKAKCPNIIKLSSSQGENIVSAQWTTHKIYSHLARIALNGIDRMGIINTITTVISKELNVNMRSIKIDSHDGVFEGEIDLYVHSTSDLYSLISNLNKIKGVHSIKRIENTED